jgi:SAM-dependent methyltransferase
MHSIQSAARALPRQGTLEMSGTENLEKLYQKRFPEAELAQKNAIWKVLCEGFFQRHVAATATVVDIGAGYCEFINNIRAARKIAVDLNPDVRRFAAADVQVINAPCTAITQIESSSVDVVFMSNFLEHLPSKAAVLDTFNEAHRILRDGGRIIVLQPNIRFLPGEYWDFFDHHTPLTDRSLVEGLQLAGFTPSVVHPRFLPYTTKSRLPKAAFLVRMYLWFLPLWRLIGKQALVIAIKDRTV